MLLLDLYIHEESSFQFPVHLFLGTSFAFLICSIAIYAVNKKSEFLWYAGYLLCVIVYFSHKSDFILAMIYENQDSLVAHIVNDTSQMSINLCYLLFSMAYLNTKKDYTKFHKFLQVVAIAMIIFMSMHTILRLTGNSHANQIQLLNIQRLVLSLFVIFNTFYLFRYGKNKLVYFVIAASLLYAGGAIVTWLTRDFHFMVYGVGLENFVFSFGLGYKIKKLSFEKSEAERYALRNEIHSLRAQMNPHFIFNSLNSIQGFILKDKKKESIKYLTSFSTLLRKILDTSENGVISLEQEIELLKRYLELESLRFDGSFKYDFDVDPGLDIYNIEIPILLVQPYIENAIIHGLAPKKEGDKTMKISFIDADEFITCSIKDSGIGREASYKLQQTKSIYRKSKGMSLTQKRLELISKHKDKMNTYVHVDDLYTQDGKANGTKVTIKIYKN
ncbi:sensor histidine kinase [Aquimarina spongiae]|uniref:7TM diverse intracellular signalling n=1 Tax=Aquimarina spongiae TaxID=570521 RepID=A0A1M6DTM7_9FLAO|nr:histidine kinase [Aquimarina spongiae]SHI76489.1 7TM diverse intracellular signalling [Aquimarina spongiae]